MSKLAEMFSTWCFNAFCQCYRLQNSRFWTFSESALSAILTCEAREPHTRSVTFSVSPHSSSPFLNSYQTFRSNVERGSRSRKMRLFCSRSMLWIETHLIFCVRFDWPKFNHLISFELFPETVRY